MDTQTDLKKQFPYANAIQQPSQGGSAAAAVQQPQNYWNFNEGQLAADQTDYRGLCQEFVEKYTYGKTGLFPTAIDAWNNYFKSNKASTDMNKMQYGDTIYFSANAGNGNAGHTGIYLGNGQMLSATDSGVRVTSVADWERSTGQQALGYVGSKEYGTPPAPQDPTTSIVRSLDGKTPQTLNTSGANHQFQAAPKELQDKPITTGQDQRSPYTVKPGDTLSGIAERALGSGGRWNELQGYKGDPKQLPVGTQITQPNWSQGISQYANTINNPGPTAPKPNPSTTGNPIQKQYGYLMPSPTPPAANHLVSSQYNRTFLPTQQNNTTSPQHNNPIGQQIQNTIVGGVKQGMNAVGQFGNAIGSGISNFFGQH